MVCVGFADFADGYYSTIDHQKVQDSNSPPLTPKIKDSNPRPYTIPALNPRPCTTPRSTSPPKSQFEPTTMHSPPLTLKVKYSNLRPCTTPPLTSKKSKIRIQDHALHHHWPPKIKDSNPRPCTTPPLTSKKSKIRTQDHALHHYWPPKRQRFEHMTMHYTIDPQIGNESCPRPCTTPPMTPKSQRFEPTNPQPCTTQPFTPHSLRFEPKIIGLHHHCHHWPPNVKDSNPRPYTTPPLTLKKTKTRTQHHALPGMHYTTIDHEGRNILSVDIN
jgi:hypothetical protein